MSVGKHSLRRKDAAELAKLPFTFDIAAAVDAIVNKYNSKMVALQFPDHMLSYSPIIARALEAAVMEADAETGISRKLFVMADTTFGSCCVDDITARHCNADLIVHLGYACLSKITGRTPVHYILPLWTEVAGNELAEKIAAEIASGIAARRCEDVVATLRDKCGIVNGGHIVVFFSPDAVHSAAAIRQTLYNTAAAEGASFTVDELDTLVHFAIPDAARAAPAESAASSTTAAVDGFQQSSNSWHINGASFPINHRQKVIFVGPSDAPVLNQLVLVFEYNKMTCAVREAEDKEPGEGSLPEPSFVSATFMENHSTVVNKRIRQRSSNIEKVKDCEAIAIVVATLSIAGYGEVVTLLKKLLRCCGKRVYVVYVGRLNEYKLANFADTVDAFCVIACPNSDSAHFTAAGQHGFVKSLVSPMEVLFALADDDSLITHPSLYTTHFTSFLVHSDSITGLCDKLMTAETTKAEESITKENGQLVVSGERALVARARVGALARLRERSYIGLDPEYGQTPVQAVILEGKEGIAKGYDNEREVENFVN